MKPIETDRQQKLRSIVLAWTTLSSTVQFNQNPLINMERSSRKTSDPTCYIILIGLLA